MSKAVKIKFKDKSKNYEIKIEQHYLKKCGEYFSSILSENTRKIVIISNRKVYGLYGNAVEKSLKNAGFDVFKFLIGDGEKYKNFTVLNRVLNFLSEQKISRTDAVIALGGGVVGDLTGFAASIYLRGIPFLQIPTTLLAMIDSSVGGKTAVNSKFGKNLIGTFYQPKSVLIDPTVLQTLPRRELTAGFCEAVKQGAISSRKVFEQTAEFLRKYPVKSFKRYFTNDGFILDLQTLLAVQIAFKAEIVAGDENEDIFRTDSRSRKILNFGHTTAHALEKVTDYSYFKHGEAVGLGILAAGEISKIVANFSQNDLNSLNDVVNMTGPFPVTDKIEIEKVIRAFSFDKKQIGNSLQWILLKEIGKPIILQNKDIPARVVEKALTKILKPNKTPKLSSFKESENE